MTEIVTLTYILESVNEKIDQVVIRVGIKDEQRKDI